MWWYRVLVCALVAGVLADRAGAQTPVLLGFLDVETQAYVRRAVDGAAARLDRPGCQDVLGDFTDASGRLLSTALAASGRGAAGHFALLRFYDDRQAPQCTSGATLAFTEIGSRVVRVCGRYFRERFLKSRRTTEIVMIHEFLHTLGLGENPPTSQAITEQVALRCGG
jgi:hypothetical protein